MRCGRSVLAVVVTYLLTPSGADVVLNGPADLARYYSEIFPTGNRNAASHKWASFVMKHASSLSPSTLKNVFKGFCPISGSPIPDNPRTNYKVTLPVIGGGTQTGVTHHCCWPCICDEHDFVQVDTKTIPTSEGPKQYNMLVLGDPCKHPDKLDQHFTDPFTRQETALSRDAPELACAADGKLQGAEYSDHGYPIIGLFFTDEEDAVGIDVPAEASPEDATFGYGPMCADRKQHGYNSGMGLIFHLVANINPLGNTDSAPSQLYSLGQEKLGQTLRNPASISTNDKSGFLTLLGSVVLIAFAVAAFAVCMRSRHESHSVDVQMVNWVNSRGRCVE